MPEKPFKPRRVSDEVKPVDITGYLFPWADELPVWVALHGTTDWFLLLFSTEDKLRAYLSVTNVTFERIKQIDDGPDFLSGIPYRTPSGQRLRIIIDPYMNEAGNTRHQELIRVEPDG